MKKNVKKPLSNEILLAKLMQGVSYESFLLFSVSWGIIFFTKCLNETFQSVTVVGTVQPNVLGVPFLDFTKT